MWGIVLWLALVSSIDPMRIGVAALLVSLSRPIHNLFAYWLGLMTAGFGMALVALFSLRDFMFPVIRLTRVVAAQQAGPQIQIALGVLALSVAAMLALRPLARQPTPAAIRGDGTPALVLEPKTPTVSSPLSWCSAQLERGSPRIAFVAGLGTSMPPLEYWGAVMAILASEAGVGVQVSAALAFMLVSYAIAGIPLVSYLISPAKTRAVVMQLHDWLRAHRRPILVVMLGVFGVLMVAGGMGWV